MLRDIWDRKQPLRIFWKGSKARVILFHDSANALPEICRSGAIDTSTVIIQSAASYRNEEKIRGMREIVSLLERESPFGFDPKTNMILLGNSAEETRNLAKEIPFVEAAHINNAAFLNEEGFCFVEGDRRYDAVLNAKPAPFKRHYLSTLVGNKVFITYGADMIVMSDGVPAIDLNDLGAEEIFSNISEKQITQILGRSKTGLMLSAEEGACYASLEYLLCGLPVVSTPSKGGRDDFYDPNCAVIVKPEPEAVRNGVLHALQKLECGAFDRVAIRQDAIHKMKAFRGDFAKLIERKVALLGETATGLVDHVEASVRQASKLLNAKNFWINGVLPDA